MAGLRPRADVRETSSMRHALRHRERLQADS